MKKYLEIVRRKDDNVMKRFNITGFSKDQIELAQNIKSKGLAKSNFTRIVDSPEDLESIKIKLPKPKK